MPTSKAATACHPNPFLERLIRFLMPYFIPVCTDEATAREDILETLASYAGRSRSEIINAARIIAFSFAALDTLAEAKASGLSPSMGLRYRGCANNLNRSCQQNEQILAKRLACDLPLPPLPTDEPIDDLPDPDFHKAIEQAEASIESYRDRPRHNPIAQAAHTPIPTRGKGQEQPNLGSGDDGYSRGDGHAGPIRRSIEHDRAERPACRSACGDASSARTAIHRPSTRSQRSARRGAAAIRRVNRLLQTYYDVSPFSDGRY
jgi:hypothetical protein